ncbi:MAG: LruC domain-containing protein [Bacteroidales bacterium]
MKIRCFEKIYITGILIAVSLFTSCEKNNPIPIHPAITLDDLVIPEDFNWATTRNITFSISAQDNLGNPIARVRFNIYTASPDSGGVQMFSGSTNNNGLWECTQPVPSYLSSLTVICDYLGLQHEQQFTIENDHIEGLFGGTAPPTSLLKSEFSGQKSINATKFVYMGAYTSVGVPKYLEATNDVVDAVLLKDLNATLPEYKPVPVYHPDFVASTVPNNIELLQASDVWITYVTEGAGWMNSIGFFVFNTNNPPQTTANIDTVKIIFPNMSNNGSGGGLYPGNKVFLGRFPAGKSIGFCLVSHGWNGVGVYVGKDVYYTIPALNPETDPNLKKHTLILKDNNRQQFLFSFEDQNRSGVIDNDFNDGICYIKVSPVTAVNTTGMPQIITTVTDQDADGVPDNTDDYPANPLLAHNNYYPGKTTYSSLAFEDLWPSNGDYDFNDLVLSYRFNQITNADNKAVKIEATLITEALGAILQNGIGFQLGCPGNKVSNVTGTDLKHNIITLGANNCETDQAKAVFFPYDDASDRLPYPGSGTGVNTSPEAQYVTPDTMRLTIDLAEPQLLSVIGTPPYNPFMLVNLNRGHEIHLPDYPPTDKADQSLFKTQDDNSSVADGKYYKSTQNHPWAMNISNKFDYMIEKQQIVNAYLNFASWAESGGTVNQDWYKDLQGYRNNAKIYSH